MIDALLYAVRDGIRGARIGYDHASCEIMDDGRPPARCGNWFVAIHGGNARSQRDNQLFERYEFSVTVTARVIAPLDRVGDQQIALNLARIPLAERNGFNAKVDKLRSFLHMNWALVVLTNQTPPSANDNIVAWSDTSVTGPTVYGFCEPMRGQITVPIPKMVGAEWFGGDTEGEGEDQFGIVTELKFRDALRFQPQNAPTSMWV